MRWRRVWLSKCGRLDMKSEAKTTQHHPRAQEPIEFPTDHHHARRKFPTETGPKRCDGVLLVRWFSFSFKFLIILLQACVAGRKTEVSYRAAEIPVDVCTDANKCLFGVDFDFLRFGLIFIRSASRHVSMVQLFFFKSFWTRIMTCPSWDLDSAQNPSVTADAFSGPELRLVYLHFIAIISLILLPLDAIPASAVENLA